MYFLDLYGPLWNCVPQCTSVDLCRSLWISVDLCGSLWISVDLCGSLWISLAVGCPQELLAVLTSFTIITNYDVGLSWVKY